MSKIRKSTAQTPQPQVEDRSFLGFFTNMTKRVSYAFTFPFIRRFKNFEDLCRFKKILSLEAVQKAFQANGLVQRCKKSQECFLACSEAVKKIAEHETNVIFNGTISKKTFKIAYEQLIPKKSSCYSPKICFDTCKEVVQRISTTDLESIAYTFGTNIFYLLPIVATSFLDAGFDAISEEEGFTLDTFANIAVGMAVCATVVLVAPVPISLYETATNYLGYRAFYYLSNKFFSLLRKK